MSNTYFKDGPKGCNNLEQNYFLKSKRISCTLNYEKFVLKKMQSK